MKKENPTIPKIDVDYNISKDIQAYLRKPASYAGNIDGALRKFLPKEVLWTLKNPDASHKERSKILRNYLETFYEREKQRFGEVKKSLEDFWERGGAKIIGELEKVYQTKLPPRNLKIYLTTLPRCPYNYKEGWFMVNVFGTGSNQLETIKHELNHFFFHKKFEARKRRVGFKTFNRIKEAFTVITLPEERAYPKRRDLREAVKEWWEEGKSLDEIFELARKHK